MCLDHQGDAMKYRNVAVVLGMWVFVLCCEAAAYAQEAEGTPTSFTGLSWGFTRTFWNGRANDEGYPQAGTAAPMIGLRKVLTITDQFAWEPYLQYLAMYSGPITRFIPTSDTSGYSMTEKSYFREIDVGLNLMYFPAPRIHEFYLGIGPAFRWGQAGHQSSAQPNGRGPTQKATWFGVSLLAGYRVAMGEHTAVFFEPQYMFSPDPADRWQIVYPPANLNLQMGILWR
jgi:hypothetical protein